jgi:hypothetical protein
MVFLSSAGMSLTKLSLAGNNQINLKGRFWFVAFRLGTEKQLTFFTVYTHKINVHCVCFMFCYRQNESAHEEKLQIFECKEFWLLLRLYAAKQLTGYYPPLATPPHPPPAIGVPT